MVLRQYLRHIWPVPRLRTIMFTLLLLVAALPGVAAIMLRVYENALVRQTEAEIRAQGAALAASAAMIWPKTNPPATNAPTGSQNRQTPPTSMARIDLSASPILPERSTAASSPLALDADMVRVARRMAPVLMATRWETLAAILLLDQHGLILNGDDAGRSLANLPEIRAALAGQPTTVLRHNGAYTHASPLTWISRSTNLRLHHAHPVLVNGQVVGVVLVSRSPPALFRGMWEDRGKIALGTGVIFILLSGMAVILARTIVHPMERRSWATRALAEGRQAHPPQPTLRVREIDGLIHDFTSMAAAIEHRSRYLRDFAAALTHEFKTPLSGLAGGIELLQDHGTSMTDTERSGFLRNMAADADRLNRLINRLMELARADMRPIPGDATCDLAALAARLADGLATRDCAIHLAIADGLPNLAIDPPALETVLTILIDNARQAGARTITITAILHDAHIHLTCTDDGPGVPTGDAERIFEPFFTSKRAQGGTGLGLAIARALLAGHHGQLHHMANGTGSSTGATFAIILPPASSLTFHNIHRQAAL